MPTSIELTAGQVMDAAAAFMNDVAKTQFTYAIQLPYLNQALRDMQELYEMNQVPVTQSTSAVIEVPAGQTQIWFEPAMPVPGTAYLPDDLIEPKLVWERLHDVNPYTPMQKVDVLPLYMSGVEIQQFLVYSWQQEGINVLPAIVDIDLKIDYTANLFDALESEDDEIAVINAQSYLAYRTAALLARFCAENPTRADELDRFSIEAADRALGIVTKGRQNIFIRRRPFRSSYKQRYWG